MNKKATILAIAVLFVMSVIPGLASADTINRGLMGLTPYKYAKVYTLTSGRYYELYSDSNLTQRLSSSHWTGENDDVWLIGAGRTSRGVSYARIKYPSGNSRIEAYAKLQDLFVAGKLDAAPKQAKSGYYGMYKRKDDGRDFNWWIDPGDNIYLLTKENKWCQVMYPAGSFWRIAWMPEANYNALFKEPVPGDDDAARNKVVAHAEKILNYEWNSDEYILLYHRGASKNGNGSINFTGTPWVAKGKIRGIPYTLENGGGVDEVPFSTYESLTVSDKQTLSNTYTYDGGSRISMKYGMACATFVTDCIMQGLNDSSLATYINIHIHDWAPGWGKYVNLTQDTSDAAYRKLKKGDYLKNGGHVILVTGNDGSNISFIDQTPPYGINWPECTNKKYVTGVTFKGIPGTYNAYQVCMECYNCLHNTIGTHRKESASYSWLREKTYYPVYVIYPSNPVSAPEITNYVPSNSAIVGQPYSFQCKADNDPTEWSVSEGSIPSNASSTMRQYCRTTIPPGLSINSSTGEINGTPTSTTDGKSAWYPLYYYFTVKASNAGGEDSKQSFICVYEPPVITTNAALSNATEQTSYSQTINAEGTEFSMRWKLKSGRLPSGLSFNWSQSKRTATISGIPKKGTAGTYKFTIECNNAAGLAVGTKEFTLKVIAKNELVFTEKMWFTKYWGGAKNVCSFKDSKIGETYLDSVCIDWASTMYYSRLLMSGTRVTVESGSLPEGLSVRISGMYVYLEGTPTKAGMYSFKLRVTNGYSEYTEHDFTMTISPQGRTDEWADSNMSTRWSYLSGKVGTPYRDYIRVNGGTSPYSVRVVEGGLFGMELSVNGNLIYLSGTPRRNVYSFTMRIKGAHNGYVDKKCTVNMAENRAYQKASAAVYEKTTKPKFLTSKLPDATIGREWSAQLEANGTKPIIWKCNENDIPEGFTLSDTGLLSGIPLELKKRKFKVTVENSAGKATKIFSLNVKQEKPSITTFTIPYGVVNAPYSIILEAEGTEPIKWSKSGKFPSGLKLVAKTGEITGKPKKAGTYNFTVKAKNKGGTDTVSIQMVVYAEEPKSEGAIVASAFSPVVIEETEHTNAELYVISGDEEIDGEITVEPGKTLEFGLLGWTDEYGYEVENPDTEILIDGMPAEGIEISDEGTFILPAEYVNGTFSVCARAILESEDMGLYSGTVTVKAEAQVEDTEDSETMPETSGSSSSGCNSGFAGIILLSLYGIITSRKK